MHHRRGLRGRKSQNRKKDKIRALACASLGYPEKVEPINTRALVPEKEPVGTTR